MKNQVAVRQEAIDFKILPNSIIRMVSVDKHKINQSKLMSPLHIFWTSGATLEKNDRIRHTHCQAEFARCLHDIARSYQPKIEEPLQGRNVSTSPDTYLKV